MSQLGTEGSPTTSELKEEIAKSTAEAAKLQAEYEADMKKKESCQPWRYSETYDKCRKNLEKLHSKLRYAIEKEFLENMKKGDRFTVLGNARTGYRPTALLAEHAESMRIEGNGTVDIVELEVVEIDNTVNNSGVLAKNVHGKKMMKGVIIPRVTHYGDGADPVYFFWLGSK